MFRSLPFLMALLVVAACGYHPSSPLAKAVFHNNFADAKALLPQGVSHAEIQEALVAAARSGQAEIIPELKTYGANLEEPSGVNNWSPLKHAIHKNQLSSLEGLLAAGANPNASTGRGGTPLMMAARYGYVPIVGILLAHGAVARQKDASGRNALDAALTGTTSIGRFTFGLCQTETVRLLLDAAPDLTQTVKASPCTEIQRLMKKHGAAIWDHEMYANAQTLPFISVGYFLFDCLGSITVGSGNRSSNGCYRCPRFFGKGSAIERRHRSVA